MRICYARPLNPLTAKSFSMSRGSKVARIINAHSREGLGTRPCSVHVLYILRSVPVKLTYALSLLKSEIFRLLVY